MEPPQPGSPPVRSRQVGRRTYLIADVAPLDVDGVRTIAVGTALWLVGLLALLPFTGELADAGRTWWLWTCAAGLGLGLFGIDYCRRRRRQRRGADEPFGLVDPVDPDRLP